jgi:hypothetical protein
MTSSPYLLQQEHTPEYVNPGDLDLSTVHETTLDAIMAAAQFSKYLSLINASHGLSMNITSIIPRLLL